MLIGIIGGGITGLTTALALQKSGFSTVVFEQAEELKEVGAGIWVQPNAMKVLDWLGIGHRIKEQGIALHDLDITNGQLVPFQKRKNKTHDHVDQQTIAIHRARLLGILFQEAQVNTRIHLGRKYVRHETHENGTSIIFENGTAEVDMILGADGINSQVRQMISPDSMLRNSGQLCWRGISKADLPHSIGFRGIEAWGRQIRFGFSQISANEVYWFAVAKESQVNKQDISNKQQVVANLFKDFSPVVSRIIANTNPEDIHEAVLHDLKRIATWHADKVCLIGDAAHATTPNMGQGACQGIEDAYYISKCLYESKGNTRNAFARFEKQRRQKVDYVVNTSWRFGKMAHNITGQALMKLLLVLTPQRMIRRQLQMLYHVDI